MVDDAPLLRAPLPCAHGPESLPVSHCVNTWRIQPGVGPQFSLREIEAHRCWPLPTRCRSTILTREIEAHRCWPLPTRCRSTILTS